MTELALVHLTIAQKLPGALKNSWWGSLLSQTRQSSLIKRRKWRTLHAATALLRLWRTLRVAARSLHSQIGEEMRSNFFFSMEPLRAILRQIGYQVMSMLLSLIVNQITVKAQKKGFVIHRRPQINYTTIFGQMPLESPYLWNRKNQKGMRPVKEKLGIKAGDCSSYVGRALTEFGSL